FKAFFFKCYKEVHFVCFLRFPLYNHAKFAFLVWLQLPSSNGAKHLYKSYLRPFLLRHQATFDKILEFINSEMSKIVRARQAEINFARTLIVKLMASGSNLFLWLSLMQYKRNLNNQNKCKSFNGIESLVFFLLPVNQIVWYLIHPMQTPQNRSIEGPRQVDSSDTQSNSED
ncbi:hypothetical protein Golob_002908, partial [Gossypium lobatum]|nr:hypothetical protein [Gossypium lobatum]